MSRMYAVVKEAAREGAIKVLEVGAASICGSDLHIWHWAPAFHPVLKPPRVIGHEFVARVAELGPGVEGPPGRAAGRSTRGRRRPCSTGCRTACRSSRPR